MEDHWQVQDHIDSMKKKIVRLEDELEFARIGLVQALMHMPSGVQKICRVEERDQDEGSLIDWAKRHPQRCSLREGHSKTPLS